MFWKNKESEKPQEFNKLVQAPVDKNSNYKETVAEYIPFPGQEYLLLDKSNTFVKVLQNKLIQLGYDIPGGANGIYGVATAKAVKNYYDINGLGNNSGNYMGLKAWKKMFGG